MKRNKISKRKRDETEISEHKRERRKATTAAIKMKKNTTKSSALIKCFLI